VVLVAAALVALVAGKPQETMVVRVVPQNRLA
jgi:hypothetical protein